MGEAEGEEREEEGRGEVGVLWRKKQRQESEVGWGNRWSHRGTLLQSYHYGTVTMRTSTHELQTR